MSKATVAIVGCGRAGSSIAYGLAIRQICDQILLCDIDPARAVGEAYDIEDVCISVAENVSVQAADYRDCAKADILVIAAGVARKPGQSMQENVSRTILICRSILDGVLAEGFSGIILFIGIKANTVLQDILHYSGLPANKIIGPGNMLDTNRLRVAVCRYLQISPESIQGLYVIGDDCATFSSATVDGKPMNQFLKQEVQLELMEKSAQKGSLINNSKETPTYYGIASAVTELIKAIVNDEQRILCVSTALHQSYGQQNIFLGIPAIIGKNGIEGFSEVPLNQEELSKLITACEKVKTDNLTCLE